MPAIKLKDQTVLELVTYLNQIEKNHKEKSANALINSETENGVNKRMVKIPT